MSKFGKHLAPAFALASAACAPELPEALETPKTCLIALQDELAQEDGDNALPITEAYMDAFHAEIVGASSESGKGVAITMDVRPGTEESVWDRKFVGDYTPTLSGAIQYGSIQALVVDMDTCPNLQDCDPMDLLPAGMEESGENEVKVAVSLPQVEDDKMPRLNVSVVADCENFITSSGEDPTIVDVNYQNGQPMSTELVRY